MEKTYKFRLYPNSTQAQLLSNTFGCVRYVYNYFLGLRQRSYESEKKSMTYYDCCKELTTLKQEMEKDTRILSLREKI